MADLRSELAEAARRVRDGEEARERRDELILELRGDGPPDGLEWSEVAAAAGMTRAAVQMSANRASKRLTLP